MQDARHYSPPTNLNREPFLSVWWMDNPSTTHCYIQINEDKSNPAWISLGDVFEMLVRKVPDFENTVMQDMLKALKFCEPVSSDLLKKLL